MAEALHLIVLLLLVAVLAVCHTGHTPIHEHQAVLVVLVAVLLVMTHLMVQVLVQEL
jgi:hypothetical protein